MRLSKALVGLVLLAGLLLLVKPRRAPSHPRICEDLGYELPGTLHWGLRRAFQRDEVRRAQKDAGLDTATSRQKPVAVWLVGPSAAGKSFMATSAALGLGVAPMRDGTDAVLVDGRMFRDAHEGYQAVRREGDRLRCVWREAYPALREQLQKQKQRLLHEAARRKQNLIIPHTCYALSECVSWLKSLKRHGYTNHVVMVIGDRNVVQKRGQARAQSSGKRYAPEEWDIAVASGRKMVSLATGYAELVWTTPRTSWIVSKGNASDVISKLPSEQGKAFEL